MTDEIKVGEVLNFNIQNINGSTNALRFRLLPKLTVVFGAGTTAEEEPIEASSPDKAFEIVRKRYPAAHWQRWDEQYAPEIHNGFLFGCAGEHDEGGILSLFFYAEPADVVHEAFRPRGSRVEHTAGIVTWEMVEERQVKQ